MVNMLIVFKNGATVTYTLEGYIMEYLYQVIKKAKVEGDTRFEIMDKYTRSYINMEDVSSFSLYVED